MRCLVAFSLAYSVVFVFTPRAGAQFHRPRATGQTGTGNGDRADGGGINHIPSGEQSKPRDSAAYGHQAWRPQSGGGHWDGRRHGSHYQCGNTYNFFYGSGYPYAPYADPYYVGPYDPYWSGPWVLPPLVIPAETMFGPQVARNMLGPDLPTNPPVVTRMPRVRGPVEVKVTNAEVKARAGRFMEAGDTHFKAQRYREAAERYRTAAQTAPDMPVALLRQGFALAAMSKYDTAAKALRRALQVRADWTESEPFLQQLYAGHEVAKTAHLEALAKAIDANEQDGDLMLVLGMELYFDGQRERSVPFFQRCEQLGANEEHLLDAFLPPKPNKAAQVAGRAGEF